MSMMPQSVQGLPVAAGVSQLSVRPAAVAGTFYPAAGAALIAQLDAMLAAAAEHALEVHLPFLFKHWTNSSWCRW